MVLTVIILNKGFNLILGDNFFVIGTKFHGFGTFFYKLGQKVV